MESIGSVSSRMLAGRVSLGLFIAALLVHFFLSTANWRRGFMGGHEFRQAQTAIIADSIDRQDNFGLYYETPLLGKPWVFPFEVPIYQWAVVGLKRSTGLKDFEAARIISLSCLYLTLPALYLLLGSWGIAPHRRLILLVPALFCPVYLFYSRAFLIDPMATCFSVWFLAAFVRTMDRRHWAWLLLATVCGSLGILIKSVIFAVWLFPAALYGLWCLRRAWMMEARWRELAVTCAWGMGTVILPYWLFREWIIFSDALKWSHPSGYQFTSGMLSQTNFGTFELSSRLSGHTWSTLAQRWGEAVAPAWILGLTLVIGLVAAPGRWRAVLGLTGLWFVGQLAFPYAYAYQDYYFYGATWWLMLAFGIILWGIWERSKWPRVLRMALALAPLGGMMATYWQGYRQIQMTPSDGGSGLTALLDDMLPEDSVIMIIGQDWAGIIPYYSQRRALMVRDALRFDWDYMNRAIDDLSDEDVAALIVIGDYRNESELLQELTRKLGMFDVPLLRFQGMTDVYFGVMQFRRIHERMTLGGAAYPLVDLLPEAVSRANQTERVFPVSPGKSRRIFPQIEARVLKFQIKHGFVEFNTETGKWLNFHPEAALWVEAPNRNGSLQWHFGIFDSAWDREGDKTNGVNFAVMAENQRGERRSLYTRLLQPVSVEQDRGTQVAVVEYALEPEEHLVFLAESNGSAAFDWTYFAKCEFESIPRFPAGSE